MLKLLPGRFYTPRPLVTQQELDWSWVCFSLFKPTVYFLHLAQVRQREIGRFPSPSALLHWHAASASSLQRLQNSEMLVLELEVHGDISTTLMLHKRLCLLEEQPPTCINLTSGTPLSLSATVAASARTCKTNS